MHLMAVTFASVCYQYLNVTSSLLTSQCGQLEKVLSRAALNILTSSVLNGINLDGSSDCLRRSLCHGETSQTVI